MPGQANALLRYPTQAHRERFDLRAARGALVTDEVAEIGERKVCQREAELSKFQ
jgi:hypothetical protein